MKIGETKIIETRLRADSPANSWTEHLALERLEDGKFDLAIRQYEVLAEASEYWDEVKDDWNLPDQIEGKDVVGIEDDYVVGGDLLKDCYDDEADPGIIFTLPGEKIVADWFKEHKWDYDDFTKKFVMEEHGIAYPVISTLKESDLETIADPLDLGEPLSPEQAKRLNELAKIRKEKYKKYSDENKKK